jgi:hypothetical protein
MSGAPVFAARHGGSSLEWVGIATSGSAASDYMLIPDEKAVQEGIMSGEPYEGEIHVHQAQRIRYGVTMGVSIEAALTLAQDNRDALVRRGYRLNILN